MSKANSIDNSVYLDIIETDRTERLVFFYKGNEASHSPARTEYHSEIAPKPTRLRSLSYGAVLLAIHPCSKLQGFMAKANKIKRLRREQMEIEIVSKYV